MQSNFASDCSAPSSARLAAPRRRLGASATAVAALGALFFQSACMQAEESDEPLLAESEIGVSRAGLMGTECTSVRSLTSYSVYAKSAIEVSAGADVVGGNVGVKTRIDPTPAMPLPGGLPAQLTVRSRATLSADQNALAYSIRLVGTATSADRAKAGTLYLSSGGGGEHGPTISPFPVGIMPALPSVPDVDENLNNAFVLANGIETFDDPSVLRGNLTIRTGGTLVLDAPGTYRFRSITMQEGATIVANYPVVIAVRVNFLSSGKNISIGPKAGQGYTAKDFIIQSNAQPTFGGTGGTTEIPVIRIASVDDIYAAENSHVQALLVAPRGLVDVGRNAELIGAAVGERVLVRPNAVVNYEDGVNDGTCKVLCETTETSISLNDVTLENQLSPVGTGDLPAAEYIVKYVDGCMKYAPNYWWSLNAITGQFAWQLVGTTKDDFLFDLPGTEGFNVKAADHVNPYIGHWTYDICVAANHALPETTFVHSGGPVNVHLKDEFHHGDNSAPYELPKWSLTRVAQYSCEPLPDR